MNKNRLHLFPDTNLFIQCNELKTLPWAALGEFDEIELIIARPIQKEIDRQKGSGNGRLGRRARRAAGVLRDVITNDLVPIVVRENAPRVTLALQIALKPNPELADRLDYSEPDDALVGIAHSFSEGNPGKKVAVLTHDGGVMASAVTAQIRHIAIPENWLSPPEDTKVDKELKAAQAEVVRLRNAEPQFLIECVNQTGALVEALSFEQHIIPQLTERQIQALLDRARRRFPKKTDFSSKSPSSAISSDGGLRLELLRGLSTPPDQADIDKYHKAYEIWESELTASLEKIHVRVERTRSRFSFTFRARNIGTRPATEALVEMQARDPLLIRRPQRDKDSGDETTDDHLPLPPSPPKYRPLGTLALIRDIQRLKNFDIAPRFDPMLLGHGPKARDPELFYYKGGFSELADTSLRLECALWRHGVEAESFSGSIELDGCADARGSIQFRIRASNLTDSPVLTVPVEIRAVESSAYEHAAMLVDVLKAAPPE
ncbi:hypothetical protein J2Y55_004605 [Bosea sp. BE125]|uniref:PIN domain-containing protein n=1 Tax=Bosea sp. BE125 TaxID=2817909 RepID=UPI00285D3050|nr:PIN domain-containing protein [Bosea sp. BE125]MDR6873578.1 hypothetical protein [Bosea sp. BE125]